MTGKRQRPIRTGTQHSLYVWMSYSDIDLDT